MKNFVKPLFILLIIFCCLVQNTHACTCEQGIGTDISGRKYENMTLTKANSPYCVTGNVIMSKNTTLTIEPGVVVKFWEGTDTPLNNKFNIIINGQLLARGTESEPIIITSSRSPASPGDWGYIEFSEDATPAIFDENGEYLEGSILEYITIEYGGGGEKSTVNAVKSPYLNHATIQKNKKTGVYFSTSAKISNSTFSNNSGGDYYADLSSASAVYAEDSLTISDSVFTNNTSSSNGGTVNASFSYYSNASLTITNSAFTSNIGGAANGSGTITNCTFTNNTEGAINGNSNSAISDCTFTGNSGGAVNSSNSTVSNCIFTDNTSSYSGGAVNGTSNNILNCTFTNNTASNGGAVYSYRYDTTISNCAFVSNTASVNGGAVYAYGTISDSTFVGNTADTGIIYAGGNVTLTDCLIYNSQGKDEIRSKYAIWLEGSGEITRCTIADNPGGIYYSGHYNSALTISGSNIFGNRKSSYASPPYENVYDVYNNSSNDIQATVNYWGTTDPSAIDDNIFDKVDDSSKGEIIFWGADKFLSDFAPDAPPIPGTVLKVSPETFNFGNTDVGASATRTFIVTNIGTDNLVTGTLALAGTGVSEFRIGDDTCSNMTVAPSGTCIVNVVFSPTSEGVKNAELLVPFGESGENAEADLTGTGAGSVQTEYTVTFTAGTGGVVTGTLSQRVTQGHSCTAVTAVPNSGYQFAGWTAGENVISAENPLTYGPVTKEMNILANFQPATQCRAVITGPDTAVTGQAVSFDGTNSAPSPDAGITSFVWFFGDESENLGAAQSHIFSQPGTYAVSLQITDSSDCSSTATHEITITRDTSFTVTFTSETGGTINGTTSQKVQQGGTCTTVTAVPNTGYKFVNWTAEGLVVSAENPLTYGPVTSNTTIYANFAGDSPGKIQKAVLMPSSAAVAQGGLIEVTLRYDCTSNETDGFGVLICYDSAMLAYESYTSLSDNAEAFRYTPLPEPQDDVTGIGGFGDFGKTMGIIYMRTSQSDGFPNTEVPTDLFKLSFRAQNFAGATSVKVKSLQTSAGFEFQGTDANITIGDACDAKATFTATVSELTATFNTTGSSGSLQFDYGDGSTGEAATHTYEAAGTYTITLTATGSGGCTHLTVSTITVTEPCTAEAKLTASVDGLTATFDTKGSSGILLSDYGDGSAGTETSHTYTGAGTYTVTLTATINEGCTDTETLSVTVTETSVPLVPPANLDARSGTDSVRLTWEPSPSTYLKGYNVYRSTSDNGPWTLINKDEPVTGDCFVDNSSLISGTTYYYHLKSLDNEDNESERSNVASAVFSQLKLFIPDSNGKQGDQILIPVNIANADGLDICASDISFTYDPAVLSVTGIKKTPLSAEYGSAVNLIQEHGLAKAVFASTVSSGTLYGEGSLLYFLFDVTGNPGDTSPLQFETGNANTTDIYKCDDLFTPLPLDLNDTGIFTVKETCILGDVNADGIVNAADVAITLELAVGKGTPDQCQKYAGDVSGDGYIRSNDAALILRLAAGLPLAPESSSARRKLLRSSAVNISVPKNATVSESGSIWIPVEINNAGIVMGADIVLNYDPSVITAKSVRTTSITDNFKLEFNTARAGQIRISLSARQGDGLPEVSGALAEVQFNAQSDVSAKTSPLTLTSVRLNDTYSRDFATSALQINITKMNGSLTVKDNIDADLSDAIQALKVLTGINADIVIMNYNSDADGNGKVEMQDVIHILQIVSDIRE